MKFNMQRHLVTIIVCLLLAFTIFAMTACTFSRVQAEDLTRSVTAQSVATKNIDDKFMNSTANFSFELFKKTIKERENSLVSPLSVMLALSMTANGAGKDTLSQMEKALGDDITIDELNEYLYSYTNKLPTEQKSKLNIANSIWFRDNENYFSEEKDFLQTNADYYDASIYKAAFDGRTPKDINNWVKTNTDGMIDKILENIDDDHMMYLINAIVLDAQWEEVYEKKNVYDGQFKTIDGKMHQVKFMDSQESLYLDDGRAIGFIKPYYNNNYSFVALLPNKDILIDDYISTLTGENFLKTIASAQKTYFSASLPKFRYEYTVNMNKALSDLGMPDAFSDEKADFSRLGKFSEGNICIDEVLHKTFISVDERGTKAGAVTKVSLAMNSAGPAESIVLNRPFVYAIIDNEVNLPIFIGTVMNPNP